MIEMLEKYKNDKLTTSKIGKILGKTRYEIIKLYKLHNIEPYKRSKNYNCHDCGTVDPTNFYSNQRGRFCCKKCKSIRSVKNKRKNKQKAIEIKGGGCEICGYNKCLAALQFHHTDPKEKKSGFCIKHGWSLERLLEEISKCQLLCSNCHAETHEKIGYVRKGKFI